jgi:hypothetical protein
MDRGKFILFLGAVLFARELVARRTFAVILFVVAGFFRVLVHFFHKIMRAFHGMSAPLILNVWHFA